MGVPSLLVYGSYGYVGSLVAREAVDRGLEPILAGRDRAPLVDQAEELGCPARRFALEDPATVAEALEGVDCVLNCAGPFSNTADALVEGCLRRGVDYVDVTGEIPVIERIRRRDEEATDAGATLLPSAGFSSVVMDCLAAHLVERLPEATHLALGVESFRTPSVGSIVTTIEGIEDGGAIRRDGRLERVPAAWRSRRIDFGRGTRPGVTMPLGDVSTAHYTTGVPNVEVYAVAPPPARLVLRSHRYVAPLLSATPVQWTLKRLATLLRDGPSERSRRRGSAFVWGEARTRDGRTDEGRTGEARTGDEREGEERAVSRLRTPDPYEVTVDAAVTVTQRVLDGQVEDGYQTPAGAFGPDFVLELDGVAGFFDEAISRRRAGVEAGTG